MAVVGKWWKISVLALVCVSRTGYLIGGADNETPTVGALESATCMDRKFP